MCSRYNCDIIICIYSRDSSSRFCFLCPCSSNIDVVIDFYFLDGGWKVRGELQCSRLCIKHLLMGGSLSFDCDDI